MEAVERKHNNLSTLKERSRFDSIGLNNPRSRHAYSQPFYPTIHDQLVGSAILHGDEFNTNNGVLYDLLQSLTLNGPAWSWINTYQTNRDK